jgi:hypothetical protein
MCPERAFGLSDEGANRKKPVMQSQGIEEPNEATRSSEMQPTVGSFVLLPRVPSLIGGGGVRNVFSCA